MPDTGKREDGALVSATVKAEKSQGRFYDALTDLFVGAKVEGQPPVYSTQYAACRERGEWPQR
jgi:hypothetical protein